MTCIHENFDTTVNVERLVDGEPTPGKPAIAYAAQIHLRCRDCNTPFYPIGWPKGLNMAVPTTNVDGDHWRIPMLPVGQPYVDLKLPGYTIREPAK